MTKQSHTAGPWHLTLEANGEYVGFVNHDHEDEDGNPGLTSQVIFVSTDKANAALIAAAPEMFQALLECEVLMDEYPIIKQQVKAAISKAEGH